MCSEVINKMTELLDNTLFTRRECITNIHNRSRINETNFFFNLIKKNIVQKENFSETSIIICQSFQIDFIHRIALKNKLFY